MALRTLKPRSITAAAGAIALAIWLAGGLGTATQASPRQSNQAAISAYCRYQTQSYHEPRRALGVGLSLFSPNPSLADCTFGLMAHDHIGFARVDMFWAGVETKPGVFSWGFYDALVASLARHHVTFLPILDNPPRFRTAAANKRKPLPGFYPPRHVGDFARFAGLAAKRYGPRGTFWTSNPQLPYDPVRVWEIWNEESLSYFWEPRADARVYVQLLKSAHKAIKAVDAHAFVLAGGIPWNDGEALRYFTSIYEDGGRGAFDGLSLHPYAPTPAAVEPRLRAVRRLMNQRGDGRKTLWVTEFGWGTAGPPSPYNAGRAQPRYIAQTLDDLRRSWRNLNLGGVFYYSWSDLPVQGPDYWGNHMGVYSLNYTAKPVAPVLRAAAARMNG